MCLTRYVLVMIAVFNSLGCSPETSARSDTTGGQDESWAAEIRAEMDKLEAMGYLAGVSKAPKNRGLIVPPKPEAYHGLNLVLSTHGRHATLRDMQGEKVHGWTYDEKQEHPAARFIKEHFYFRKAHLFDNGNLVAILGYPWNHRLPEGFTRIGMVKLDRNSNVVWEFEGRSHHDFDVADNGDIIVFSNRARMEPQINRDRPVLLDSIVTLDAGGNEKDRFTLLECILNAGDAELLTAMRERSLKDGDVMHSNSLEILPRTLEAGPQGFKKGNLLISIRELHTIAVIDPAAREMVWSFSNSFRYQHDAHLLDNDHILLFDNRGPGEDASAVLEIDPRTGETVWSFVGSEDSPFRSDASGAAYRLPNGNTLIVESNKGRVFEVTPEKKVVWSWVNPKNSGLYVIAQLMDVERINPTRLDSWLSFDG